MSLMMQPRGTEFAEWMNKEVIGKRIRQLQGSSLKARFTCSSMILGAAAFGERALRLVRNMILARLLVPEDFGVMAIVLTVCGLLEALNDVGVRQSIIHSKRGLEYKYLNMAWWFQAVRGLGIYAIAFLAAPLVSLLYGTPELTLFLKIACLGVIFNGLINPRIHVMEKEMKFGRWILIVFGANSLGTAITIGLAFVLRNVWALVLGFTAEAIFRCLLSFIGNPFCPRFAIHRSSLWELLKYARGMLGLTLLTMVALKTDVLVLGKVVSKEQLGIYALAFVLAQQPGVIFGQSIARVMLSAFAEKQDNKTILCFYILRIIRLTFVVGVPFAVLAALFARPILSLVYGSQYSVAAIPFGILCFSVIFHIQGLALSKVFLAIGKPALHRRFVIFLAILIVILMYPGAVLFGLSGAAVVVLLANAIAVCAQVVWMRRSIGLALKDYICSWFRSPKLSGELGAR